MPLNCFYYSPVQPVSYCVRFRGIVDYVRPLFKKTKNIDFRIGWTIMAEWRWTKIK